MSKEIKTCLFCQTDNEFDSEVLEDNKLEILQCRHCGMELPDKHPNDRNIKVKFFVKAFWLIVLFCVFMVFYLPR